MKSKMACRLVLICMVLGGLLVGCEQDEESVRSRIPRVKAFEVRDEAVGQTRSLSGQLAAADTSPLSFGVAGTVERVHSVPGDMVEADQLLASLDSKLLQLTVESARNDLLGTRAIMIEAEQAHQRATILLAEGAASRVDVEVSTSNLRTARAAFRSAQSDLERAQNDLEHVELRAPFAGRVAERSVEPFQEIGANEPAFILQGNNALVVETLVPETLIRFVDYGQPVRVRFRTIDDLEISGVVSLIGAKAGAGNSFPVEVRLSTTQSFLRPGMTASVTFNFDSYLDGRSAFLIPISALAIDVGLLAGHASEDRPSADVPVFVFDEETNRLRVRNIRVGGLRGNQLEVFDGLLPGDKVIIAGVPFLREGMEVELWSAKLGLSDG